MVYVSPLLGCNKPSRGGKRSRACMTNLEGLASIWDVNWTGLGDLLEI